MTKAEELLQSSIEKIISEIFEDMDSIAKEKGQMSVSMEEYYTDDVRSSKALKQRLENEGFSVKAPFGLITEISWANPSEVKSDAYKPAASSFSSLINESDNADGEIPTIGSPDYEAS